MTPAAIALLLGLALGASGADEHLLAGANAFREQRFDEALVEFRVALSLGSPDAAGYLATTLVKLGRFDEAVESFGGGDLPGQDPLVDYYRALACHGARLYQCADRLAAAVGDRAGPRVGALASDLRTKVAPTLAAEPSRESIDWYLSRATAERAAKRPGLATALSREAAGLSRRRPDRYRLSEAEAGGKR